LAPKSTIDSNGGVTVKSTNENEGPTAAEREPNKQEHLDDGPKRGQMGEYLPARYLAPPAPPIMTPLGPMGVVGDRIIEDR
jgi:hypothetical protein